MRRKSNALVNQIPRNREQQTPATVHNAQKFQYHFNINLFFFCQWKDSAFLKIDWTKCITHRSYALLCVNCFITLNVVWSSKKARERNEKKTWLNRNTSTEKITKKAWPLIMHEKHTFVINQNGEYNRKKKLKHWSSSLFQMYELIVLSMFQAVGFFFVVRKPRFR